MEKARAFLASYRSFIVTAHLSPDGDAVGSEIALYFHLRALGKTVFIVNDEPLPELFRFLAGSEAFLSFDEFRRQPGKNSPEAAIFVECCSPYRAGETGAFARRLPVFNIDHHFDNTGYGRINLVDARAAACGEIVYHLLNCNGAVLTPEIAAALYTAILTDTSAFRFNVGPETLRVAADLVEKGACPDAIAGQVFERLSFDTLRLLAESLATLRRSSDGLIAWCRVDRGMYGRTATRDSDSEGFIDYLRVIDGVAVTFILKELPGGKTRVNLRSKGDYDVQGVASAFGGGGHRNAAGCTLEAGPDQAEVLVLRGLAKLTAGRDG